MFKKIVSTVNIVSCCALHQWGSFIDFNTTERVCLVEKRSENGEMAGQHAPDKGRLVRFFVAREHQFPLNFTKRALFSTIIVLVIHYILTIIRHKDP